MSKALDAGKSLAELVLAKLPEHLRESAKATWLAPEAADALTVLGESALARSDYSKAMDDIKTKSDALTEDYTKLTNWYDENRARLEKVGTLEAELAALKADPNRLRPVVTQPTHDPDRLTRDDLLKTLEERDRGYAHVLALGLDVAAEHLQRFGEKPDMQAVVQTAETKRLSLKDAYQAIYGEKLAEKTKAEEAARIDKIVNERLAQERKALADQPFPIRNASPSVLDVIEQKQDLSKFTVDSAVAEYDRLQASRG